MKRETKIFIPDINPSRYKAHNAFEKSAYSDIQAKQTVSSSPSSKSVSGKYLFSLIFILLIFGLAGFAWKYYKLSNEMERLTNQVTLIHERLPLADQLTNQDQFEQNMNQRIDEIEKRFAEIVKSSNEIIGMVERITNLDLTKEVQHLQELTRESMEKLDKLEQQVQLLSNQQESIIRNQPMDINTIDTKPADVQP